MGCSASVSPGAKLTSKDPMVRLQALSALPKLKAKAVPLLPELAKLLQDEDEMIRGHAVGAFEELFKVEEVGSAVLPYAPNMAILLTDESAFVRKTAVQTLGGFLEVCDFASWEPWQQEVVPQMAKLLQDPEKSVRICALGVLGRLAEDLPLCQESLAAVMEEMVAELKQDNTFELVASLEALRELGIRPDKLSAKPFLLQIAEKLQAEDETIRALAALALGKMDDHAIPFLPKIVELLKDEQMVARMGACDALDSLLRCPRFTPYFRQEEIASIRARCQAVRVVDASAAK